MDWTIVDRVASTTKAQQHDTGNFPIQVEVTANRWRRIFIVAQPFVLVDCRAYDSGVIPVRLTER
jgi:hypothetical protein